MKRRIVPTAPTCEDRRQDAGSVTLEAAIVMPAFLIFVFFLLFLVKASIAAMALHGAVSETVRVAAASWYPLSAWTEGGKGNEPAASVREAVESFGKYLPPVVTAWAETMAEGASPNAVVARQTFHALLTQAADERRLDSGRLTIAAVELPTAGDPARAFLTVTAEYRLGLRVPFGGPELTLHASARERTWTGGSPSRAALADPDASRLNVTFVSMEPNPARRGRRVTLTLRTDPGAVLDLAVIYKSGRSQAKHLGSAAAGADGLVSWTWLVSGNTTPGTWDWQVTGTDGAVFAQPFQVAAPNGGDNG